MPTVIEREIEYQVPLDYSKPKNHAIQLFAREIFLPHNRTAETLVYLQGGPGFASPREFTLSPCFNYLLQHFRIMLLDQRGTGRSQKVGPETSEKFSTAEKLADYLCHFRADNIVNDCEFLRQRLKRKPWFLLGQSYGGFVACHYLSVAPRALKGVMLTGGLPPLTLPSVSDLYEKLVETLFQRNCRYYKTFPRDSDTVRRIIDLLLEKPYRLSEGGTLTAKRFLDCGIVLGTTTGFEVLHGLLDDPFVDRQKKALSYDFTSKIILPCRFQSNPIYALLHESIYCDNRQSCWAADKVLHHHPAFDLAQKNNCFHAETIRKNIFNEYRQLVPFKKAADLLAKMPWPSLYNKNQLASNTVPVEALIYENDLYVDRKCSVETAKLIANTRFSIHPTFQHDALRTQGELVIKPMVEKLLRRIRN